MTSKRKIYKFRLVIDGEVQQIIPGDENTKLLKPLSVGTDLTDRPCMWVLVETPSSERHWFPDASPKPIRYIGVGTGQNDHIPERASFLGTIKDDLKGYIWHVFTVDGHAN
jgi:hypothetical protein